eukprot:CAMPEP_0206432424 /NCGR_PEP_ID=MMETSP0324_2-20121206/7924_1 /ASSEMBLY_ACC=CAM_ASM_000836 /TAXON_ID=2866 /ORGANISM="Crypthecodinium cohnii, Strain Seligo" /LENGTH=199 /DNA_ID=CAMNT_0053898485 /DNA_START=65 /DNA_END=664 /DNA_ORIENTATION=-
MADAPTTSTKGATVRVWGRQQEPEKSRLTSAEKRYGLTWDELHAYKDRMLFPQLPTCMGVEELSKDISLCDSVFRGLDRCLTQGTIHEDDRFPYARMQICKPHWIKFNRCVNRRDELIMRNIKSWEKAYVANLDPASRSEYVDDIDSKMRYFLYAAANTGDAQHRARLEMNAQHCAIRQASLMKSNYDGADDQVAGTKV